MEFKLKFYDFLDFRYEHEQSKKTNLLYLDSLRKGKRKPFPCDWFQIPRCVMHLCIWFDVDGLNPVVHIVCPSVKFWFEPFVRRAFYMDGQSNDDDAL